ncbi:recombinase family protein [Kitasatospora sp. NPDC008115]|uniref:recombinase family protein n=1 Tax=Kitasatospora sp. NPDC008115 TaxID=3364022 RepID=UPI0036E11D44
MARKPAGPVRNLGLLLRKSQVVRGTAARDILSLKAQETRGRAWGKANGYTIRNIYRENLSAYKLTVKRPEFDAAVHTLLDGESDCLRAYDSSRYSRKGAGDVLKILDSPGKRLVFDINGLDTERPEDRRRIIENAERDRESSAPEGGRAGHRRRIPPPGRARRRRGHPRRPRHAHHLATPPR